MPEKFPLEVERFLQTIFKRSGVGYMRIIEVRPSSTDQQQDWDSAKHHFAAVNAEGFTLPDNPATTSEWYFNPALLKRPDGRGVKENIDQGSVLWVDIDQQGVNPFDLRPVPSLIVESSPGKCHCYWLLDVAIGGDNLDHYNRRLSYSINGADNGTWNCNRVLRIPFGVNLKYSPPHPVRLIHSTDRVYSLSDFEHLPQTDRLVIDFVDEPLPEVIQTDTLLRMYADTFTVKLSQHLNRKQVDRSRALWWIYHECYRLEIPKEHCFGLVLNSPNNKFADEKRSGDVVLWREICHAYREATQSRVNQGILATMEDIKNSKLIDTDSKGDALGDAIVRDMERHGTFYRTPANSEFFFLDRHGRVIIIEKRNPVLWHYVKQHYGLNVGSRYWDQIFVVLTIAGVSSEEIQLHSLAHYDRLSNVLYVNRYDGQLYKLTKDAIELCPNGIDGVVFNWNDVAVPYVYKVSRQKNLLDKHIFASANIAPERGATEDQIRFLLFSWFLAAFFPTLFRVKPILLMHGQAGSGKTAIFKMLLSTLFGPKSAPRGVPRDEREFEHILASNQLAVFDNVDEEVRWITDALARAATGYRMTTRKLYTDSTLISYEVSAFIGITSRTPKFMRDDVAERTIPVRVIPFGSSLINESTLMEDLAKNRDYLWGEIFEHLQHILQSIATDGLPTFQGDFRQADFAAFLQLTSKLRPFEVQPLLDYMKFEQAQEALDSNPLLQALLEWTGTSTNLGREISPADLHIQLQFTTAGQQYLKAYPTVRGMSIALAWSERVLTNIQLSMRKLEDPIRYVFESRRTQQTPT